MKILQMSRCFFPYQGGATVRTYQTAKNLVKRGHEVHLLVHNPKSIGHASYGEAKPYEEIDGIKVYRLPYFGPQYLYFSLVIPMMAFRAMSIIKKNNIDVILAHNPPYIIGLSAFKASKATGVPMVFNVHDPWGSKHHNAFELNVGRCLEGFCCGMAKKLVTASETIPKTLNKRHGLPLEKFVVSPNGADVERFEVNQKAVEEASKKYGIPKDKKVVFFLGSMAKWNGVHYLIEAAGKLKDVSVVVAGGGRDEAELKEASKKYKNVIMTGTVPYQEVPALMNLADVCVAPFPETKTVGWEAYESTTPHLLLEYMACGKPIVCSDAHNLRNILGGDRGLLVKPEDPDEIAKGVRHLLDQPKEAEKLGAAAKNYAKDELSWFKAVGVIEKALEEAIND